jgi:hypothetical protein
MNRLGDDSKANPLEPVDDTTPRIVAALLLGKTDITSIQTGNGDVRFILPLRPAKVSRADLLKMDMAPSNALANFRSGDCHIFRNKGFFPNRLFMLMRLNPLRSTHRSILSLRVGCKDRSTGPVRVRLRRVDSVSMV